MALTSCRECNFQISTSAKTCPQCGTPNPASRTTARLILGAFAAVSVVVIIALSRNDKPESDNRTVAQEDAASASSAEAITSTRREPTSGNVWLAGPPEQQAVVAASEAARKQYAEGSNDMAKGAARPARGRALCTALSANMFAQNWVGSVKTLDTNSDGKGVLSIQIGPDIEAKTWNNALSDIADNTLIDPDSALYAAATQLKFGQIVHFNGYFINDDVDCIREASVSLDGSIRNPEFLFRFRDIAPGMPAKTASTSPNDEPVGARQPEAASSSPQRTHLPAQPDTDHDYAEDENSALTVGCHNAVLPREELICSSPNLRELETRASSR